MNGHDEEAFERAYGPCDADEWGPRLDDDAQAYQAQAQAETLLDCPYCDLLNERATLAAQGWVL